jgi:hypothetical protein
MTTEPREALKRTSHGSSFKRCSGVSVKEGGSLIGRVMVDMVVMVFQPSYERCIFPKRVNDHDDHDKNSAFSL